MLTPVIVTIPILVLPLLGSPISPDCQFGRVGDPVADARAIEVFEAKVSDYVTLQRRLDRAWPTVWFVGDLKQFEIASEALRKALHDARPLAAQGDFFTPEVAAVLRFRVATALRERDATQVALATQDDESGAESWEVPVVNKRLGFAGLAVSRALFDVLPLVPLELDYRIVGRDLVLLDRHADMALDVLDLAIPTDPAGPIEKPVAPEDEETDANGDSAVPVGDEFIGCWYGEVRELTDTEEETPEDIN